MTEVFTEDQVMRLGKAARTLELPVDEETEKICGISFFDWGKQRPPTEPEKLARDKEQTNWIGAVIQGLIHKATDPNR
jgi:hypothetical protein